MESPMSHQTCIEAFRSYKAVAFRGAYYPLISLGLPLWVWTLVFRYLPYTEISKKLQWREKVVTVLSVEGKKIKEQFEIMC